MASPPFLRGEILLTRLGKTYLTPQPFRGTGGGGDQKFARFEAGANLVFAPTRGRKPV